MIAEYFPPAALQRIGVQAIFEDEEIVGVSIYRAPASVDGAFTARSAL